MVCTSCSADMPEGAVKCLACGAVPTLVPKSPFDQTPRSGAEVTATRVTGSALGSRVGGRFELLELIGRGGMAVVYRARDLDLGMDVALKVLPPEAIRDPRERERLKREIVTTRAINHKNVIRIYEFGLAEEPFICMELLTGGTLAARLEKGPLPVPEALRIGRGIAEGLAAAHAAGVIHRDVKPANVLFDGEGEPKLVDFGLARVEDTTSSTIGFAGTPNYMSPEMAEGHELTVASDVYSFGVVLFEMVTGHLPFEAKTLVRLVVLHTKSPPPVPSKVREGLAMAEWLDPIILRCLAKEPARRFADGSELALVLAGLQSGSPPPPMELPRPPRRLGRALGLAGGGTLLALGGGLLLLRALHAGPPAPLADPPATPPPVADRTAPDVPTAVATSTPRPRVAVAAAAVTGSLVVAYRPWFEVDLDGKPVGNTESPRNWSGALKPGHYHLRFYQPGTHLELRTEVDVRAGQRVKLMVDGDQRTVRLLE